jgi:hypothetical protein
MMLPVKSEPMASDDDNANNTGRSDTLFNHYRFGKPSAVIIRPDPIVWIMDRANATKSHNESEHPEREGPSDEANR